MFFVRPVMTARQTSGLWASLPLKWQWVNRPTQTCIPCVCCFSFPRIPPLSWREISSPNPSKSLSVSVCRRLAFFLVLPLSHFFAQDPTKRPTAKLLLKHKFIKLGKKTGMLTDLIERRAAYVSADEEDESEGRDNEANNNNEQDDDGWEFETVKGKQPVGPGTSSEPVNNDKEKEKEREREREREREKEKEKEREERKAPQAQAPKPVKAGTCCSFAIPL